MEVPVRRLSEKDVLNTAVRFVYPSGIVDGQIRAHICSGINGLSDAKLPRDPFLEALVYSTILGEIHREDSPLHARIREALGLAESLDSRWTRRRPWHEPRESSGRLCARAPSCARP